MKLHHFLTQYTKINTKLSKDLNVKTRNHKNPRGKHSKISDISHSNIFSDISPWARETKEKINKQDCIKLKSFCTAKETINKMKTQPTEWKDIFTNDTSDKELISKVYEELIQLNGKKQTIQFSK